MYRIESFGDLLGKTLANVENNGDEMIFTLDNGQRFKLFHNQDCREQVSIEDVIGDLQDLIGLPLTMAEVVSGGEDVGPINEWEESFTWTFYKLATVKGYVTVRWYGTSNGYYSESVDFAVEFDGTWKSWSWEIEEQYNALGAKALQEDGR
jgi:hypothetical protein